MEIRTLLCAGFGLYYNLLCKIKYGKRYNCTYLNSFPYSTRFKIGKGGMLSIGNHLSAMRNLELYACPGAEIQIGDNVNFNTDCAIVSRIGIKIGNRCIFGPNCKVYDHDHDYAQIGEERKRQFVSSKIEIGNGVWFGANCIILQGTEIGDNCVFGAGCIIKGKYPPATLVIQKPTEIRKDISSRLIKN